MNHSGTYKIVDGLFVGDQHSARDQQHILSNAVGLVLNCCQLPNYYQHYGIRYEKAQLGRQRVFQMINECMDQGISVLLIGVNDIDEPLGIVTTYLIRRYSCGYIGRFRWSLFKTLQYIQCRTGQILFTENTSKKLQKTQLELLKQGQTISYHWIEKPICTMQLTLRNTFLNHQVGFSSSKTQKKKQNKRISWKIHMQQTVKLTKVLEIRQNENDKLRSKILMNVRRIASQDKLKEAKSLSSRQLSSTRLKKYKSTYTLPSSISPSLQLNSLQSQQNVPSTTPWNGSHQPRKLNRTKSRGDWIGVMR